MLHFNDPTIYAAISDYSKVNQVSFISISARQMHTEVMFTYRKDNSFVKNKILHDSINADSKYISKIDNDLNV